MFLDIYSESEDDDNPMVAGFQDDLDSEDEVTAVSTAMDQVHVQPRLTSKDIELSSEEDEIEEQNSGEYCMGKNCLVCIF